MPEDGKPASGLNGVSPHQHAPAGFPMEAAYYDDEKEELTLRRRETTTSSRRNLFTGRMRIYDLRLRQSGVNFFVKRALLSFLP